VQGINDYIQENLNKYFVENFGEKSLCGEFRDNEVNMFMDTETKPVLKKNPVISEWKLIWDAKYELDYDVLKWEDDVNNKSGVIVKVDLPGVFSGRPSKAAHKKPEKNNFVHMHEWTEPGASEQCLQLTVRLAKKDGLGPSVEVHATRSKKASGEDKYWHDSGKHGKVVLIVSLAELDQKFDAFQHVEVNMGENGSLTMELLKHSHTEVGCWQSISQCCAIQ